MALDSVIAPAVVAPVLPRSSADGTAAAPLPSSPATSAGAVVAAPVVAPVAAGPADSVVPSSGRAEQPAHDETKRPDKAQAADKPQPAAPPIPPGPASRRRLVITFRRTGDLERDKYRLREIYEMVRDPRGRDSFLIKIESSSQTAELAFPNDGCTISKRLESDLKRLKLEVDVQDAAA